MHSSLSSMLKRIMPVAFAVAAMTVAFHAPARADSVPQSQACGSVDLATADSGEAAKAFDCFKAAFVRCSPATLVATSQNGGTATTWTLVTVSGSDDYGCSVSQTRERATSGVKTTDAALCRSVHRDKDGLLIGGCSNQQDVALRLGAMIGTSH